MEQRKTFGLIIGTRRFPLEIDRLTIDRNMSDQAVSFRFQHRAAAWWGRLDDGPRQARLSVGTDLGIVPFSAEAQSIRQSLTTIIAAANAHCGDVIRVTGGRMLIESRAQLEQPVSAVALVGTITRVVAPLNPYIELIRTVQAFKNKSVAVRRKL